jgi:hypothetical protein
VRRSCSSTRIRPTVISPPAYYYLGQAREGLQTAGYKDVYGEYLKIRGKSTEDPLLPDVRRRAK